MPAPKTPDHARSWIKEAMGSGRYTLAGHFLDRMRERGVDMLDVISALDRSARVEPYAKGSRSNGGTAWRVIGPDVEGDRTLGIGVEAFLDPRSQRRVLLCTVIVIESVQP